MNPEQNTEQIDETVTQTVESSVTPHAEAAPAQPAAQPAFDPNAIASAAAQAALEAQRATQPAPPDPNDPANMTPEQQAEYFKTFNIDEDFSKNFVQSLQPDDEGNVSVKNVAQVLSQFRDGVLAQAMRHDELLQEQYRAHFEQKLTPIQQAYQHQAQEKIWNDFALKHKHLAQYRSMVDQTASALKNQGYRPKSQDDLFDTVASAVTAQLKQINPQLEFPPPSSNTSQTNAHSGMNGTAMSTGFPTPQASRQNTNEFFDSDVFGS